MFRANSSALNRDDMSLSVINPPREEIIMPVALRDLLCRNINDVIRWYKRQFKRSMYIPIDRRAEIRAIVAILKNTQLTGPEITVHMQNLHVSTRVGWLYRSRLWYGKGDKPGVLSVIQRKCFSPLSFYKELAMEYLALRNMVGLDKDVTQLLQYYMQKVAELQQQVNQLQQKVQQLSQPVSKVILEHSDPTAPAPSAAPSVTRSCPVAARRETLLTDNFFVSREDELRSHLVVQTWQSSSSRASVRTSTSNAATAAYQHKK